MLSAVTRRGAAEEFYFSQPRGHVYAAVRQENHAFFLQQCALYALAAKGKAAAQAAVFKYHAVARDAARLGLRCIAKPTPRAPRGFPARNATCP